jgi:histidinol dehydrogenase
MIPVITYHDGDARLADILRRRSSLDRTILETVEHIIGKVRSDGDAAVRLFAEKYDGVTIDDVRVDASLLQTASEDADPGFMEILGEAAENIRRFHERQREESWSMDDGDGVRLGMRIVPLTRVGLYVPGGKAFYPSSLLMNVIPAQVAGVREIHLVSPPGKNGLPHPLVLAGAHLLGVKNVYSVGGAQAVAALAFGTATIPVVDKITGPGNAYVAAAKKLVYGAVSIDSIAGPSEIVVLADDAADPEFVAADLLSQAEHDERASGILVTDSSDLAQRVAAAINRMVPTLPRREIIEKSLRDFGALFVTRDMDAAVKLVNKLAPEHLELLVREPESILERIDNAGAVFLGPFSPEPVGDYFAGPNHVLPTDGTSRFASPLGVYDFVKRQSVISYTRERLLKTGARIAAFARAEELHAHARAIEVRLERESRPPSAQAVLSTND